MGPCFLGAGRSLTQLKGQQGCPFIPSHAEGQHESHESHESNSCTKPQFPQQLSLCVLQVGPLQHTLTELAPASASDFSSLNTSLSPPRRVEFFKAASYSPEQLNNNPTPSRLRLDLQTCISDSMQLFPASCQTHQEG